MLDVAVIEDPAAAGVSLDPVRARMLAALAQPGSATTLAAQVGLSRQKANYHLRALERHGLVELVEERRKGNMTERVLQATAASYLISPTALAAVATVAIDTEIRFASAADRAAFAAELSDAVEGLVGKYHDEAATRGRKHRLAVAPHPSITEPADTTKEKEWGPEG